MSFDKQMTDRIVRELSGAFPNCEKRVRVWADVDKYKWKEEETVWAQKKGITSANYEAYFDGEFICFMDDGQGEQTAWKEFISKFRDLYKEGKIFVHEQMYEVKKAEQEAANLAARTDVIPEAHTPEEKMVADVLVKHAKKKGRRVVRK